MSTAWSQSVQEQTEVQAEYGMCSNRKTDSEALLQRMMSGACRATSRGCRIETSLQNGCDRFNVRRASTREAKPLTDLSSPDNQGTYIGIRCVDGYGRVPGAVERVECILVPDHSANCIGGMQGTCMSCVTVHAKHKKCASDNAEAMMDSGVLCPCTVPR